MKEKYRIARVKEKYFVQVYCIELEMWYLSTIYGYPLITAMKPFTYEDLVLEPFNTLQEAKDKIDSFLNWQGAKYEPEEIIEYP